MLKQVAYIGYGFVGKACHKAFEHNTESIIIDPKYTSTTINDLSVHNPLLTFVSINAPTLDDRTVDASAIYTVFKQLHDINYRGLVVLKSTLPPEIVHDLYLKYGSCKFTDHVPSIGPLSYIYSPEFLREKHWEEDAVKPDFILMAGGYFDCEKLKKFYINHSHVKHPRFKVLDYKEAALLKYAINSFLASKVLFMNQLYQLYSDLYDGETPRQDTWQEFTGAFSSDIRTGHTHISVPGHDGKFGYGGTCFPKDVKAMIGFDTKERLTVLRETEQANTKIRLTGDIDHSK